MQRLLFGRIVPAVRNDDGVYVDRNSSQLVGDHVSAGQRARESKNGNGDLALFAATSLWNGFVNGPVIVLSLIHI